MGLACGMYRVRFLEPVRSITRDQRTDLICMVQVLEIRKVIDGSVSVGESYQVTVKADDVEYVFGEKLERDGWLEVKPDFTKPPPAFAFTLFRACVRIPRASFPWVQP